MSLLLDALRRAEQAKQGSSLSLEPVDAINRAPTPSPAVAGVTPGPPLGSAARRAEQEAAKAVFTAKQLPTQNRPLWLAIGGLALLAITAGVFWLWYALNYPAPHAPIATPPTKILQAKPLAQTPVAPSTATTTPASEKPADPTEPTPSDVKPETPKPVASDQPKVKSTRARARISAPSSDTPKTQIKPSARETAGVSPELSAAYQALVRGDYTIAKQQYQQVVNHDPFNLDAYLGLATVAASTGDLAAAQAYYRKVLEIDPKNTVALAGLATMQINRDASVPESQLRAQITDQPDAAPPYSALGHLYASQGRWGEAQQAFFEAYRLDASNPDYAFNLAVSLDQLGQGKLAREYYGKAIALAASRPAAFDTADATTRMNRLAP